MLQGIYGVFGLFPQVPVVTTRGDNRMSADIDMRAVEAGEGNPPPQEE